MVKDILDEFEDFEDNEEDDIGLLEDEDLYNDMDITVKKKFNSTEDDVVELLEGDVLELEHPQKPEKKSEGEEGVEVIMIDRHKIINLNDYETTEIEDNKEDIEEIGDFEREDYWEEAKDGYEGLDLEEL